MSNKIKLSNFTPEAPIIHQRTINGIDFEITDSIPYEELLTHIQWAIMLITDSNGYVSEPVKIACQELILVAAFTNLDMSRLELATIEQTELYEMYDIVKKTGIIDVVEKTINTDQLHFFKSTLSATLLSILNYRNSIAGIIELLSNQNEELQKKFTDILGDFQDPAKTENVLKIAEFIKNQSK